MVKQDNGLESYIKHLSRGKFIHSLFYKLSTHKFINLNWRFFLAWVS